MCAEKETEKSNKKWSEDFKETSKDGEEAMDTQSLMQFPFYCTIFNFSRVGLSTEQITYKWLNSFIRVLNIDRQAELLKN
jgi:hypothetical protein